MKRLLLLGHARHGKDTTAQFLKEMYGYTFKGSSEAAAEIFLYDALKVKYNYTSPEQCFEDRVNHRAEWYELICDYNRLDKARLAKEIMKTNDIYVGMRDDREIEECVYEGLFDMIIGVFDPRKPLEPSSSFKIDIFKWSDLILLNNGTLDQLKNKLSLINFKK